MKPSRVSEGSTSAKTSENRLEPNNPDARLREISTSLRKQARGPRDQLRAYPERRLEWQAADLIDSLTAQLATLRLREESTARQVRGETIEECAKVAETHWPDGYNAGIAASIRALRPKESDDAHS